MIARKSCCETLSKDLDANLRACWLKVFPDLNDIGDDEFTEKVLHSLKRLIRNELTQPIQQTSEDMAGLEDKIQATIQHVLHKVEKLQEEKSFKSLPSTSSSLSEDMMKQLIAEALRIYDADKTGVPDFALEPAGASIVNTRCSETYDTRGIQYNLPIFGILLPFWRTSNSPRTVIQPTIAPGECWAFKGHQGHLVIKLSTKIVPSSFTYEHIPKQISPYEHINSAPAKFQVRGLREESDKLGDILGNYEYLDNGVPLQNFAIQDPNPKAYEFIELTVQSNHGHNEYTCLYRFRVHGRRANL
jgi:SUN domain-containing protein 1/2